MPGHAVAMPERGRLLLAGLGGAACLSLIATFVSAPAPRLVWNASRSAPLGLYRVYPGAAVAVGDMVITRLPKAVRRLAADRQYLPNNVPLVKRVVAVGGARICARGVTITVAGPPVARRQARDRAGQPLAAWQGCRTLGRHEVFLLMAAVPDSFDGRYFGPITASDVIGKAVPLWVR